MKSQHEEVQRTVAERLIILLCIQEVLGSLFIPEAGYAE
jgi:hypothetical protein